MITKRTKFYEKESIIKKSSLVVIIVATIALLMTGYLNVSNMKNTDNSKTVAEYTHQVNE